MAKVMRQTVKSEGVSYIKVVSLLVLTIVVMNMSIQLLQWINPYFSSYMALAIMGFGIALIAKIVLHDMANYVYKIIGKELIIERIVGRNNHTFYTVLLKEIRVFEKYIPEFQKTKVSNNRRFLHTKDKKCWYYIEYSEDGYIRRLVIEPEIGLVKSIEERM
jgi:hypothetical protein